MAERGKREEYEVIRHNTANFHVFVVNLLYRTPHSHKDFEVGLVIDGELDLISSTKKVHLTKNDIFLLNPYQTHELLAASPALILSLQIPPGFFEFFYPRISHINFVPIRLETERLKDPDTIRTDMMDIAREYFFKEDFYEFRCANIINQMFYFLLTNVELKIDSNQEQKSRRAKGKRTRRIMHYIDEHYTERLRLSDIAGEENLDLYYLSHFFKENFGVSFQTYVNKLRCEHARHLLLTTDHSLLDISIESGFSDSKYFNKSFQELYGCLPKQYRKNFETQNLKMQQKSMLSTQEFLSDKTSIVTLRL